MAAFVLPSQMDDQSGGSAPPPSSGAPFMLPSQMDDAPAPDASGGTGALSNNASGDGWLSSTAKSLGTATIGGISNAIGTGGNTKHLADLLAAGVTHLYNGQPIADILQRYHDNDARVQADADKGGYGGLRVPLFSGEDVSAPIYKRTGEYQPTSGIGRLGQAGVETAVGALASIPAGGILPAAAKTATRALPQFATSGVAETARTLPAIAVSGAAGQAAQDYAPDNPYAGLVGSLVGGVGAGAASHGAGWVAGHAADAAKGYLAPVESKWFSPAKPILDDQGNPVMGANGKPLTATAGQQRMAGADLRGAATDPETAINTIETAPRNYVPGDDPTAYELTGDRGIGAQQKTITASGNENIAPFNQRREDQGKAIAASVAGVEPDGTVTDVPAYLQTQRDAIAAQHDAAVAAARKTAEDAASGTAIGGHGTPEDVGNALRGSLEDARAVAREQEGALHDTVDPDKNLALDVSPTAQAAKDVRSGMPVSAKPMEGEEKAVFDIASSWPKVQSYEEVKALSGRVSDAMATEKAANGKSQSYRRLVQLRQSIGDAMDNAASVKHMQEQAAVQSGILSPDETMAAKLQAQADAFRASKNAAAAGGDGAGAISSGGDSASSGVSGAAKSAGRGSSNPTSPSGVPSQAPTVPNWNDGATERLKAANAATIARSQTFDEGVNGQILRSTGRKDAYKILDSRVPDQLWKSGPDGFEVANGYLKATASLPDAMTNLHDAAALSLRKAAMNKEGVIDPAKYAKWQADHADALRAVPGIAKKFATAGEASKTLADLADARAESIKNFEAGAAGKVIGAPDATSVKRLIGGIFGQKDAVAQMQTLKAKMVGNPDAVKGVRRAIMDHIFDKYVTNSDTMKSDQFQTFVRNNEPVLREWFSPEEVGNLKASAASLKRQNQSVAGLKLVGQSDTSPNLGSAKAAEGEHNGNILSKLWKVALIAKEAGSELPIAKQAIGLAAVLGHHAIGAAREAGIKNVRGLMTEAHLNPDLWRVLAMKASRMPNKGSDFTLAQKLGRMSMFSATNGPTLKGPPTQPEQP